MVMAPGLGIITLVISLIVFIAFIVTNGGISFNFPLPFGLSIEQDVKLRSVKVNLFEGVTGDCGI
jgi:hypothetical protein